MKKLLLILSSIMILLFCGCSKVIKTVPDSSVSDENSSAVDSEAEQEPEVTTVAPVKASVPTLDSPVDFKKQIQAENGAISGNLKLAQSRKGYANVGYITGFNGNAQNNIKMSVQSPASQHYNISIIVASDEKQLNYLTVNDSVVAEFSTTGKGTFENIVVKNVYLPKGLVNLGIKQGTGNIDLDFMQVENSKDVSALTYTVTADLINPNANTKTKNTMKYLVDNYGKNILSGQYATPGTNDEINLIYKTTGRYPAIRLSDLAPYTSGTGGQLKEVEKAIAWSQKGGMVSYVWHWDAPMNESSSYADQTSFDLTKAMTTENIATLSLADIAKLRLDNKISEECLALIKDIDLISSQLQKLQENGVTVLWRPLSEASGGWYWWGSKGADSYKWLWNLLYERMTNYHKLNNLIWVWNAQDVGWYVGDDKCDIISADVYAENSPLNSQVNTFIQLHKISGKKLIAMSECAAPPLADNMLRDRSAWSFFGVWSGDYAMDKTGALNENYISRQQLINTYNHENIITREKLPDFLS